MYELRYEAPDSLDAAVGLIAEESGEVRLLAGGTDLLVQMHTDLLEPELIVDVKNISELNNIEKTKDGFRFGAAVTANELINHPEFCLAWPGIVDGVKLIGSVQIKGRATVAGNLCNASPAADSVPPLMAAGAMASLIGPSGKRDLAVSEITVGPGQTVLEKGEMIVGFTLPERPPKSADAYLRFTPRTEMDIAVVGVAVNLVLDDKGFCDDASVALGAVAEKAIMVEEAREELIGSKLDDETLANLAQVTSAACRPINDKRGTKEYRTKVAGVLAKRATVVALSRVR